MEICKFCDEPYKPIQYGAFEKFLDENYPGTIPAACPVCGAVSALTAAPVELAEDNLVRGAAAGEPNR